MAAAYISEYATIGVPGPEQVGFQCPKEPALAEQLVGISGSPTQSNVFQPETRMIRVNVDSACSVAIGANPTANTSAKRLSANQTEFFAVNPGHKISVVANV